MKTAGDIPIPYIRAVICVCACIGEMFKLLWARIRDDIELLHSLKFAASVWNLFATETKSIFTDELWTPHSLNSAA